MGILGLYLRRTWGFTGYGRFCVALVVLGVTFLLSIACVQLNRFNAKDFKEYEYQRRNMSWKVIRDTSMAFFKISNYNGFKLHGEQRYFTIDGKLLQKQYFHQGELVDSMYVYDEKGNVRFAGKFVNQYLCLYNNEQTLVMQAFFKGSSPEGPVINYSDNGKLKSILTYKNGELCGPIIKYDSTGTMRLYMEMKNGLVDGYVIHFGENGVVKDISQVKNNELNGRSVFISKEGLLEDVIEVKDGSIDDKDKE